MFSRYIAILAMSSAVVLSGCASGTFKARQEQREKLANSTGMFCEFISGDLFPDLDVELSMKMANRCDANKNFSVTNYKNSSDQPGVIYCCATTSRAERKSSQSTKAPAAPAAPKADSQDEVVAE